MQGNTQQPFSIGNMLRSYVLITIAGAWIIGMLLADLCHIAPLVPLCGAMLMGILAILLWRNLTPRLISLLLLSLCLGAGRYSIAAPEHDSQAVRHFLADTPVQIWGTVVEMPRVHQRSRSLTIDVSHLKQQSMQERIEAHGQITVLTLGTEFEDPYGANYGSQVVLYGKLQAPQFYHARTIQASITFPAVRVTGNDGNSLIAGLMSLRLKLASNLEQILPQPAAAVMVGIVLGLHTPGLKTLEDDFRDTGTTHLLVTSGSNITLLAGMVTASLRRFYTPRWNQLPAEKRRDWRRWLTLCLIILSIITYTILSGAGVAAVRAGIMAVLLTTAPYLGRRYNIYTALAFTLLLMSVADPFVLWDIGFQLSYLSTVGIVIFTPFFLHHFRWLKRVPGGNLIAENAAVTLAAQVATLPIFALTFQHISLVAPLANILVVPGVEILLLLGLLTCLLGLLFYPLAILCGWIAWPLLWYLNTMVIWCAELPFATIPTAGLDAILGWGYYSLIAILAYTLLTSIPATGTDATTLHGQTPSVLKLSRRTRTLLHIGLPLLTIIVTGASMLSPPQTSDQITITFLPVGTWDGPPQGQAILIRTTEKTILIDGGPDKITLGYMLDRDLPSWQRSLDLVVLTCPRAEHIQGLQDVVTRYTVGSVIDAGMLHPNTTYARWRRIISERELPYYAVSHGSSIALGSETTLEIVWPPAQHHKSRDEARDNGLILRLVSPGLRLLLLGASAQSSHAIAGLVAHNEPQALHADIVQAVGENTAAIARNLGELLRIAHHSQLILTPGSQRSSQIDQPSAPDTGFSDALFQGETVETNRAGTIEIESNSQGWRIYSKEAK